MSDSGQDGERVLKGDRVVGVSPIRGAAKASEPRRSRGENSWSKTLGGGTLPTIAYPLSFARDRAKFQVEYFRPNPHRHTEDCPRCAGRFASFVALFTP